MTDTSAVIDKIAKLLRLAEGKGATPGESANAAAQAQRLMDRHKLSRGAVDAHSQCEPIERSAEPVFEGCRLAAWRRHLAAGVAFNFDCRVLIVTPRDRRQRIELVGRPSDVQVTRYVYVYVSREIDRLCKEGLRQRYFPGRGEARTWGSNFRAAAAVAIVHQLQATRRETQRQARLEQGAGPALVRLENTHRALNAFVRAASNAPMRPVGLRTIDAEAQAAGHEAGSGISLRDGLAEGRPSGTLALP